MAGITRSRSTASAPWSASDIPSPRLGIAARPMTSSMIAEAIDSYVLAADARRKGGIDGVEVHAAHGYLIQQFLSPITNRRTDDYGGPLENRMRLLLEVLTAVREEVGAGFPVGVRGRAGHGRRGIRRRGVPDARENPGKQGPDRLCRHIPGQLLHDTEDRRRDARTIRLPTGPQRSDRKRYSTAHDRNRADSEPWKKRNRSSGWDRPIA